MCVGVFISYTTSFTDFYMNNERVKRSGTKVSLGAEFIATKEWNTSQRHAVNVNSLLLLLIYSTVIAKMLKSYVFAHYHDVDRDHNTKNTLLFETFLRCLRSSACLTGTLYGQAPNTPRAQSESSRSRYESYFDDLFNAMSQRALLQWNLI